MGRHSRGAGEPRAPLPDPPARHPYAPRSVEDTGVWDRSTYRVVDVGVPPAAPPRTALRPVPESGPSRFGGGQSARPVDAGPPRFGATRADLAPQYDAGPPAFRPPAGPAEPRFGATRADVPPPRYGGDPVDSGFRSPPRPSEPRFGSTRADLAEPSLRPPAESRFGADPADLAESRFAATQADPAESRFGATRADVVEPPLGAPRESRFGSTRADLVEPPLGAPGESRFGATRADLVEPSSGAPRESRFGATRADLVEPSSGAPGARFGAAPADLAESRFGATRADLYPAVGDPEDGPPAPRFGAESVGSTALAPRPARDPDEVTDTGARRARSAFRLATETDETDETDDTDDDHEDHEDEDEDDYGIEHEPSLILQWGIFFAQTLTGAVAGLGVWLGFYRLWSTWPFYAAPAVGVVAIAMLVLARSLRRRHGHDVDLLTAVVTVGIATVLTVLPAAFTLQGLTP